MEKERILITGGAGYLGSIITRHFLENNHKVTCLDNLMYQQTTPFFFADNPSYNFVLGDVRDENLVRGLVSNHDTIIPLAAIVGMPACNRNPVEARKINHDAIVMINNLRSESQKLIFPTTNSGYGAKSGEVFCTEETPLEPISLYGQTKSDAEKTLLESNKDAITLRLATVFGVSPRMRTDLLVNDFVLKALTDSYLVLYEKDFKRNYIHIKDVARAFEHCIDNFDTMRNRTYNLGLEDANLSKEELALKIRKHIPSLEIFNGQVGKDPDKRNYIVSNKRILSTGFRTRYTLEEGIRELIKGYRVLFAKNPFKNS